MTAIVTYKGHTVVVTDDLIFNVTGPWIENDTFASYREAREEIDKAELVHRDRERKGNIFSVDVLNYEGHKTNVTKINANNGNLSGITHKYICPDNTWLRHTLVELNEARNVVKRLEESVRPYVLRSERTFGHRITTHFADVVNEFLTKLQQKKDAVDAAHPDQS